MVKYAIKNPWNTIGYVFLAIALVMSSWALWKQNNATNRQVEIDRNFAVKLAVQQNQLFAAQDRSCKAINGAVRFWTVVRESTILAQADPTLPPGVRAANQRYIQALSFVIRAGNKVIAEC